MTKAKEINFVLPVQPARVTHQSGTRYKAGGGTYKTHELRSWERQLAVELKPYVPDKPMDGAIHLEVDFVFRGCKSKDWGHYKITKPDTDNLVKTLKDVMTRMGFWHDDAQVAFEIVTKMWSNRGCIVVAVRELDRD